MGETADKSPVDLHNQAVEDLRHNAERLRLLCESKLTVYAEASEIRQIALNLDYLSGEFTKSFTSQAWSTAHNGAEMMVQAFKPLAALASQTKSEPPMLKWWTVIVPVAVTVVVLSAALLLVWLAKGQG